MAGAALCWILFRKEETTVSPVKGDNSDEVGVIFQIGYLQMKDFLKLI